MVYIYEKYKDYEKNLLLRSLVCIETICIIRKIKFCCQGGFRTTLRRSIEKLLRIYINKIINVYNIDLHITNLKSFFPVFHKFDLLENYLPRHSKYFSIFDRCAYNGFRCGLIAVESLIPKLNIYPQLVYNDTKSFIR